MPVDISHLTVKANLKSTKSKSGKEKDTKKMLQNAQTQTFQMVQQMLIDFVPMVRDDMYDRLNR